MSHYKNAEDSPIKFYGFCSYPNCNLKTITQHEPFVQWDGIKFKPEQVEDELSPIAKLAAVANPEKFVEKFGHYGFNIELHPECAAEWGMHLIQDALKANYNLGSRLRDTRNAVQKQSRS